MRVPTISVVVPVLNSEKTIENCIKSLLNQDYPKGKYEIIIVDNRSSDNTSSIIQKYGKNLRFLKEQKRNSYYARNKGIVNAKGSIIAFIDSDCIADRNWLSYISKAFENKSLKIVGGKINSYVKNTPILEYCDIFYHPQELFLKSTTPFFATANMAVRKKDLDRVGAFNASLESGGDVELCSRLIKSKREMCYEPKAIVNHLYPDSLIKSMKKSYYYGKWHKFRKRNLGTHDSKVPMPGLFKILSIYGINFLFFRIFQGISYKSGFYFGKVNKH